MKSWGLIPDDHDIDHKLLLNIVDKDKDGSFSFDDFAKNFPAFNSKSVEIFGNDERSDDSPNNEVNKSKSSTLD